MYSSVEFSFLKCPIYEVKYKINMQKKLYIPNFTSRLLFKFLFITYSLPLPYNLLKEASEKSFKEKKTTIQS